MTSTTQNPADSSHNPPQSGRDAAANAPQANPLTTQQPTSGNLPGAGAGEVVLVGAGPGDPGLITVAGLEALRQADVVVFDALANADLLEQIPAHARCIDAGKRSRNHKLDQDQINALLVEHARSGARVVRLKGGDPYLFGRGAEEVIYCARHGIRCRVIPGITSGIAGPTLAGIPITHRRIASTLTLVTGHEEPDKLAQQGSAVDYAALAGLLKAGGTVCFYMGVGRLGAIAQALQSFDIPEDMPAALVQWATLPVQKSVRATLGTLEAAVRQAGLGSPAIIVVGQAAGIVEPGLDFFTRRPLFGRTIIITRTRQQASQLRLLLQEQGANVLEAPTIALTPPQQGWQAVDEAIRNVSSYDWLVLTSANAVATLAQRLEAMSLDSRHLHATKLAIIGQATAAALWEHLRLKPDLIPPQAVAESLAGELIARQDMKQRQVLILQADIARPALTEALEKAGAKVDQCIAYHTALASELPEAVRAAVREKRVDWVTFTSASTARNMVQLLGDDARLLSEARLASIGPITTQAMKEQGLTPTVEAKQANVEALVAAIVSSG